MTPPPRNPVFAALDQARFTYSVRHTPAGLPYAGFRWAAPGVPELSVTAIAQDGVVRLTVHDLPFPRSLPALELSDRMRRIPIVRIFRDPDAGAVDLTLTVDVADAGLEGGQLIELLQYMAEARAAALGKGAPGALPALGSGEAPGPLPAILAQIGIDAAPGERRAGFEVPLPGMDVRARVLVADPGGGWLSASGGLSAPVPLVLRPDQMSLLDRLQNWAPAGRFLISATREITAEVASPLLGRPPAPVLRRSLDRLLQLLGTARLHASR